MFYYRYCTQCFHFYCVTCLNNWPITSILINCLISGHLLTWCLSQVAWLLLFPVLLFYYIPSTKGFAVSLFLRTEWCQCARGNILLFFSGIKAKYIDLEWMKNNNVEQFKEWLVTEKRLIYKLVIYSTNILVASRPIKPSALSDIFFINATRMLLSIE